MIAWNFQRIVGTCQFRVPWFGYPCGYSSLTFNPLHFDVEFIYIFNDWFLDERYRDTLDYIEYMGCHYFYNEIPLYFLGL